ncbi:MAG: hypothetical protein MZV70_03625 [Desulfobacterales bacterium]|nr:hypothetical protein [Desulfobacterales bacterium]
MANETVPGNVSRRPDKDFPIGGLHTAVQTRDHRRERGCRSPTSATPPTSSTTRSTCATRSRSTR